MKELTLKKNKGFSLIEVLVSLSIFTVVVTISVSTLYTLIEANARSRNAQSIATNLSFTLDSMVREIRTGSDYHCGLPVVDDVEDCNAADNKSSFSFVEGGCSLTGCDDPTASHRIAYRLDSGNGVIQRKLNNDGVWQDLTASDVVVDELLFFVEGSAKFAGGANTEAPIVTVFIKGHAGDEESVKNEFNIQATVPQRLLDI